MAASGAGSGSGGSGGGAATGGGAAATAPRPLGRATSEQLAELAWLCANAVYKGSVLEVAEALPAGIEGVHVAGINDAPIVFLRARWRNCAVLAFRGTDPSTWSDIRADMDKTIKCWHVPVEGGEMWPCPSNVDSRYLGRCEHNHHKPLRLPGDHGTSAAKARGTGAKADSSAAVAADEPEYNCIALQGGFRRRAHKCPFHVADLLSTASTAHDYFHRGSAPAYLLVTGHSLGGGAAVAYTLEALLREEVSPRRAACITFAAPMTIDKVGVELCESMRFRDVFTNFVNFGDPVPWATQAVHKMLPCRFDEWGTYLKGKATDMGRYEPTRGASAQDDVENILHQAGKRVAWITCHTLTNYCPTRRLAEVATSGGFWIRRGLSIATLGVAHATLGLILHPLKPVLAHAGILAFGATAEGPGGDAKRLPHDYMDPTSHVPGVFQLPAAPGQWSGSPEPRSTHDATAALGMPARDATPTAIVAELYRDAATATATAYYLADDPDRPSSATTGVSAWLVVTENPLCAYRCGQVVARGGTRHGKVVGARPASLHASKTGSGPAHGTRLPVCQVSLGMPRDDPTPTAIIVTLWCENGGREYHFGVSRPAAATEQVEAWLVVVDLPKCTFNKGDVVAKGGPRHGLAVGKLSGAVPIFAGPREDHSSDEKEAPGEAEGDSGLRTAPGLSGVRAGSSSGSGSGSGSPTPVGPTLPPPDTPLGLPKSFSTPTAATTTLFREPGSSAYYLESLGNVPTTATETVNAWLIVVERERCKYAKGDVVAKGGARHGQKVGALVLP